MWHLAMADVVVSTFLGLQRKLEPPTGFLNSNTLRTEAFHATGPHNQNVDFVQKFFLSDIEIFFFV